MLKACIHAFMNLQGEDPMAHGEDGDEEALNGHDFMEQDFAPDRCACLSLYSLNPHTPFVFNALVV
jgi:hypothetical protein